MRLPISRYDAMEIRKHMIMAINIHGKGAALVQKLHNELLRRV